MLIVSQIVTWGLTRVAERSQSTYVDRAIDIKFSNIMVNIRIKIYHSMVRDSYI